MRRGTSRKLPAEAHLDVPDAHVPLDVVADDEVPQHPVGGDPGLLDDVGTEGDPAHVLLLLDHRGNRQLRPAWRSQSCDWLRDSGGLRGPSYLRPCGRF